MIEGQDSKRASRKLTYGMVGGGQGAFIGDVHRKAIAMDGLAELTCGCFSQELENTLRTGEDLGLNRDRLYPSYEALLDSEAGRNNPIDFLVIVTPNVSHFDIARLTLDKGIHVVCDKPLTTASAQAEELVRMAEDKSLLFGVTYAYTGYPMVQHLKDEIAAGLLGQIRFVHAEYPQEWLATPLEKTGQKQSAWRTDPARAGASNCVGDIGSHIENMVSYLTGLEIDGLCARLDRIGPERVLDDNASILLEYKGGAKGIYWSSQIAIGHDNGFKVRIYGSEASVEWCQESPNYCTVSYLDKPKEILSRGRDRMSPRAQGLSRIPSGHPEGYFEAFANYYTLFLSALAKKISGDELTKEDLVFTDVRDGLRGVRYIEKCVESSNKGAVWLKF